MTQRQPTTNWKRSSWTGMAILALMLCACAKVVAQDRVPTETRKAGTAPESSVESDDSLTTQRDQLYKEANAAWSAKDWQLAAEKLQQIYQIEERIYAASHQELIGTLQWQASTAHQLHDWESEIAFLERALTMGEVVWAAVPHRVTDLRLLASEAKANALRTPEQRAELVLARKLFADAREKESEGFYSVALDLYQQCQEIYKKVLGEAHPSYATTLNNLAALYKSMGDYARAEPLYLRCQEIRKKVLGEAHPSYATTLNNLAYLYESMGAYARAEPLYLQCQEIQKKVLGEEHPSYARTLNNLAFLYESIGDYARAEPLYLQCQEIRKKVLGEEHPDYARTLNNLALLYKSMGDYARAEPLYLQCQEIKKKALGEEHPDYAATLNNLGRLYESMGDYARAEPLYLQCQETQKKVLGEEHPDYATTLSNLAGLYESMGDYARAESLYLQCQEIRKKVLGEEHPAYAATLNGLALLYEWRGKYSRAEPLYLQCQEIKKKVLGEEHPSYAATLNNLAGLYKSIGDYARAEPLYRQCQEIDKKALGEEHPSYATTLNNLALLYKLMGDYARAEPLFLQCQAIQKKVLGEEHPSYATTLNNLAGLYQSMGEFSKAIPLYEQSLAITRKHLEQTAAVQSERQQLAMNQMLRYSLDNYLQCCLKSESIPPHAVEQIIGWKGATLVRQRGLRLAAEDPAIAEQFKSLQSKSAQLAALVNATPNPADADGWRERVRKVTREKEDLESELMRKSAAFRDAMQHVTLAQVQAALPKDAVLVDILEFAAGDEPHLLASVIWADRPAAMLDLGPATIVGQRIDAWRVTFGMSPQAKQAGQEIRQQIWEPLLPYLADAQTILLSPDGVLGRLPFAALPGREPGSYLIEDHRIALIPVPQLLPALVNDSGRRELERDLLLMGDVDYDQQINPTDEAQEAKPARRRPGMPNRAPSGGSKEWAALQYSGQEVDAISGLYRRVFQPPNDAVVELRSSTATEQAFRDSAPECLYLHLATHGFFAEPKFKSALSSEAIAAADRASRSGSFDREQRDIVRGYSPGQLSGLVFAGANKPIGNETDEDADDGIMTSDEIAFLPLGGVRMAVLSACQTGLGESAGGEGLLGVQRAFQIAGVDTTVATLWSVNDPATARFMQEFYNNHFEKGKSTLDALRDAQLWALNNPDAVPRAALGIAENTSKPTRLSPQFWAPYVLSGDWR